MYVLYSCTTFIITSCLFCSYKIHKVQIFIDAFFQHLNQLLNIFYQGDKILFLILYECHFYFQLTRKMEMITKV